MPPSPTVAFFQAVAEWGLEKPGHWPGFSIYRQPEPLTAQLEKATRRRSICTPTGFVSTRFIRVKRHDKKIGITANIRDKSDLIALS